MKKAMCSEHFSLMGPIVWSVLIVSFWAWRSVGCQPEPSTEVLVGEKIVQVDTSDGGIADVTKESHQDTTKEKKDAKEPVKNKEKTANEKWNTEIDAGGSEQSQVDTQSDKNACASCGTWEDCVAGVCEPKQCKENADCSSAGRCVNGSCRSTLECCRVGSNDCVSQKEKKCVADSDGCGKWQQTNTCVGGSLCYLGKCSVCRHRRCASDSSCCSGTSCQYNYCLVKCDKSQGELNNPKCQPGDFCFPLKAGGPAVCIPEGKATKGKQCSIINQCLSGMSCVDLLKGKGFTCYTDCQTKNGQVENPACTKTEQCPRVNGAALDGICIPFTGKVRTLYETCDLKNNLCKNPYVCTGEPNQPPNCLETCDPTKTPSSCPVDFLCAAYNPSTPTKGICLQRCSKSGTKDNCKYGLCRTKGTDKLCL